MLRLSILAATRTAQGFLDLGDTDAASVWCDQAYGLARRNNWAWSLAKCHVVFGDLLRRIGSLERSRDIYLEAMPAAGRGLSRCQWGLARTLLALGSAEEALPLLADAAESAERLHDAVGFCGIELERARALTQLDRCDEAFAQIARAQARAAEEAITLFDPELLEAQADVVTRRGAAPEPGRTVSQAVAALLQEAIETGSRQPDWRPPPTLLIKLARAQSANGDLSAAVANYERSILATDIDLARRVRDRVAAAQAQEEIERARREAEEQQSLALAESSRANDLQAVIDAMRETQEALARRTEELERLSMLDALTGVPNRRHLDERAAAEMALMRRKSTLLALVLFDLDHFKMINDTYGHAAGDIVLKTVAETARGLLRPSDFIARIGGEEFTLLLPRTNLQGAATIADRIRQSLMALNIIYAEFRIPVTASFGVTLLSENDGDITEAMSRADIALYRAKRDGRNMVRIEAV
jgi:diguanylate cyclase (GGDEF)-like protein